MLVKHIVFLIQISNEILRYNLKQEFLFCLLLNQYNIMVLFYFQG